MVVVVVVDKDVYATRKKQVALSRQAQHHARVVHKSRKVVWLLQQSDVTKTARVARCLKHEQQNTLTNAQLTTTQYFLSRYPLPSLVYLALPVSPKPPLSVLAG